jgi:cytosolic carboxypeptidase protein 2/3
MSDEILQVNPLVSKGYSLEADMLRGWRPPKYRTEYPLLYETDYEYNQSNICIYTGYKPPDSFAIHAEYSDGTDATYPFEYSEPGLITYLNRKRKLLPCIPNGMAADIPDDCLIFDSKFEGGNLDRVEMVSKDEYDLYMRIDTNTNGHMHWFYFSVSQIKYKRTVKFNIVNFTRSTSLYAAGMKPRVFSAQEVQNGQSAGWELGGDQVNFTNSKVTKLNSKKQFYMLTFTYKFKYSNDKVWFATSIPYTYCRLEKIFKILKSEVSSYITTSSLCRSLSMVNIPLVTITNPNIPIEYKKYILTVGRVHPAETVGSWVMEGFIRFLSSKHPEAAALRNKFIFKIVPMLNPDGVIVGNSRTSMSGDDLNRTYINPSEDNHPEITALKDLVQSLTSTDQKKIFLFIDIHGHFSKKGSFIYGPSFPMHNSMYIKTKLIPRLMGERTEMFRYYSSKFNVSKNKKKAARAVMSSQFKITHSYTLETSYYGYFNHNRETLPFTPEKLFVLGEKLARSILEYQCMLERDDLKYQQRKKGKTQFIQEMESKINCDSFGDFDFEIPDFSFSQTTNHHKFPTDTFTSISFKHETHAKRDLDEWVSVKNI